MGRTFLGLHAEAEEEDRRAFRRGFQKLSQLPCTQTEGLCFDTEIGVQCDLVPLPTRVSHRTRKSGQYGPCETWDEAADRAINR